MQKQHQHYHTLILKHFLPTQPKDTRYIFPALSLPLIHLSILECNPDKDIITPTPTIQLQHENAHIYDHNGTHLITIPATRLNWLWLQYHTTLHNSLIFIPSIQSLKLKLLGFIKDTNTGSLNMILPKIHNTHSQLPF
jgi:hypothetical protein